MSQRDVPGILITYIPLSDHYDPNLEEFTYGEWGKRAVRLPLILEEGTYVFFHTSVRNMRYITAYFVVDRVLNTHEAIQNRAITSKYKNPHLHRTPSDKDVIVFGDPILSKKLERPLPFIRELAENLQFIPRRPIPFSPNMTDNQCISTATRAQRVLAEQDVDYLLDTIHEHESEGPDMQRTFSTDEILELQERNLEDFIAQNPKVMGEGFTLIERQVDLGEGDRRRIDLLLEDSQERVVVVEIKLNEVGRTAVNQLRGYMRKVRADLDRDVRGILLCKDLMQAFVSEIERIEDIEIWHYGWKLSVFRHE